MDDEKLNRDPLDSVDDQSDQHIASQDHSEESSVSADITIGEPCVELTDEPSQDKATAEFATDGASNSDTNVEANTDNDQLQKRMKPPFSSDVYTMKDRHGEPQSTQPQIPEAEVFIDETDGTIKQKIHQFLVNQRLRTSALYLILFLACLPIVYYLGHGIMQHQKNIEAQGYIVYNKVIIKSPYSGKIQQLTVRTGQNITQGSALVQLFNQELADRYQLLKNNLSELHHDTLSATNIVMEQLHKGLELATQQVVYQEQYFENIRQLHEEQEATNEEFATAKQSLDEAKYRVSQFKLAISQERQEQEEQKKYQQDIARKEKILSSTLSNIKTTMQSLSVKAPITGTVADIAIDIGDAAVAGQELIAIASPQQPNILAYLPPKYANLTKPGTAVTIELPSGQHMQGVIDKIPYLTTSIHYAHKTYADFNKIKLVVTIKPTQAIEKPDNIDGKSVKVFLNKAKATAKTVNLKKSSELS